jgi:transposase
MIRIDAVWLAVEPLDMRAGTETALARVVRVFGEARAHHAYLFVNRRSNRIKVLVHDGLGIWLCARRLHQGRFIWANAESGTQVAIGHEQLQALLIGLPWWRMGAEVSIRVA